MFDEATQKMLLQEFLAENREALDRVERGLLQLEQDPSDRESLLAVFRDMHTIKGNCRMLGFVHLEELTHTAESLLDLLREGKRRMEPQIGGPLLGVVDTVRATLRTIEQTGDEGQTDFAGQVLLLGALLEQENPSLSPVDGPPSSRPDEKESPQTRMDSIRISIDRLDGLMNQIGELGSAYNQLKYAIQRHPSRIEQDLETLGQQIQGLQHVILQYRLQPIGQIWDNCHRLVRDLAVETRKKVILELSGEETEVDRGVLVAIKEVLGHLIRNAIDHGIERPGERTAQGKSPVGRLKLSAEQKHGQIHLEIQDDGRGIDVEAVRRKAMLSHLMSPEQAMTMGEAEILRLILLPGFSTAKQLSKISGRGTGLDVVRAAVDKLGGTITITSQQGSGSQFHLRIPQTMAIVPALLVSACRESYAIPQAHIIELLSLYGRDIAAHVEGKMRSPMVRVRDRLFPLVSLLDVVAKPGSGAPSPRTVAQLQALPALHVVLLQSEELLFALAVDGIQEPANLVIKPLHTLFANISILAGMAVLADGSACFLLNVEELHKS
ncbi:MAG: ATP-binding protein [Magnetococcus sp. MYC-9]